MQPCRPIQSPTLSPMRLPLSNSDVLLENSMDFATDATYSYDIGGRLVRKCGDGPYNIKYAELYACAMENRLRGEWNMPMRIGYTHASISGVNFTSSPLPYNYSIKAYINWRHSYNRWGIL